MLGIFYELSNLSGFIYIFLVLMATLWWARLSRVQLNLPPGPRGLPLLGYLPFLGKRWHETFSSLSKKYGGVVGLHIGTRYFVILDEFSAIKEAFNKDEFQSRPKGYFQISPDYKSIMELSGLELKDHRRFLINTFKALGFGKNSMDIFIMNQIKTTMAKLMQEKTVDMNQVFTVPLNNILLFLLYGKTFESTHPFLQTLPELNKSLGFQYYWQELGTFFPFLRSLVPLFHPQYKHAVKRVQKMANIIREEINEHSRNSELQDPKDFIDFFLLQMKTESENQKNNLEFNENSLIGNLIMLLGSGTVTTRLTLMWLMMNMAKHPNVQEKILEEIVDHIGLYRDPETSDQDFLHYTCAAIEESRRVNPMTYFNLFRQCNSTGAKIQNYDIPKDTIIIQNQRSLNLKEALWPNPEQFDPDRFRFEGKLRIPEHFIPFSYGKRICPGAKLASSELFLFTVCLIRKYRILPPECGLSMEPILKFDVWPAKPLLRFELRN